MMLSAYDGKNIKHRVLQDGDWERLLCEECDSKKLGPWDDYGKEVLIERRSIEVLPINHPELKYPAETVKGCDYKKLRLFLLSMLWRGSISKRPFFKRVNLGPHEEKIKQMIWDEDPGEEMDYPILTFSTRGSTNFGKDWTFQPTQKKLEGHHCTVFFISGIQVFFFISNHNLPDWVGELTMKKDGSFIMFQATEDIAKEMINENAQLKLY